MLKNQAVRRPDPRRRVLASDVLHGHWWTTTTSVNFYDGQVRVVDPDGKEFVDVRADANTWTTSPSTSSRGPTSSSRYLKKVGWKGFVDGTRAAIYRATPLARLNVADGMADAAGAGRRTRRMFAHARRASRCTRTLATHWARVIELLYAAERAARAGRRPGDHRHDIRTIPTATPTEGVGIVEAPRGTLTHHYTDRRERHRHEGQPDRRHDQQQRARSRCRIKKAARGASSRRATVTDEGMLNMVEMAFRAYDPCFGCATHALPGADAAGGAVRGPWTARSLGRSGAARPETDGPCPSARAQRTVVVGLGNPLLTDDGVGVLAARACWPSRLAGRRRCLRGGELLGRNALPGPPRRLREGHHHRRHPVAPRAPRDGLPAPAGRGRPHRARGLLPRHQPRHGACIGKAAGDTAPDRARLPRGRSGRRPHGGRRVLPGSRSARSPRWPGWRWTSWPRGATCRRPDARSSGSPSTL